MLQIRLLGQFDVRLDSKRVTIASRAGQSLLAYLVLTAGTSHRREKLAGLLWSDVSDESARKNLRQELWRIRKTLAMQNQVADYLLADEYTVTFNRNADYWLDATQLERPDLEMESLSSNLSLYQGELLPGFFEDWVLLERERILAIFETKMEQLLNQLITTERWIAVQEQGERWLSFGNSPEPAYRALMLAHGARGDITKVSAVYQRCITDLDERFGLEPSTETRALYDGLLKGTNTPRSATIQHAGTITFLFTDIEESTNLLDKLGDQYVDVLADHHKIMRAAIQKWNGHEVDTQGDAFFVTFTRASDAIQCAAEAQRNLAAHKWLYGMALRVRMGLHTGEPLIASTGYVGMDVHRAARIGDAAHGGQVLLSHTTRELVIHDIPNGLSIRDLGEYRLKDLKFPAPIYQLVIEGLTFDFPPLRTKFTGTEAPTPGEPPFKGLQYFDEMDSELFFGREALTAKLIGRLRESQFLSVVIGASGSGKSSVVRAGVIPLLRKGTALIDGSNPPVESPSWRVHILTPTAHPLEALATELTRDSESVTATATLMDDLMQDPRSLGLYFARQKSQSHTLLVLDQFEELFTLCHDEFEREAFIDNLLTALSDEGRITIIITLRADFYAHLAQYPELRDVVAHHQEYIGPMTTDELRRAIEEPAKRAHWAFEPGLVDLILRDVGEEPGALPLLSHALLETWKRRAGHTLTLKGYADAGGVRGAISYTAESVYQNLSYVEQTIARNIFLRLTELGEGTEDTRRRATFGELTSNVENVEETSRVLNLLAGARLITLSENTAEVAHEALIREWHSLREWLNQDREGLRLHRNITEGAQEWELLERDPGTLYRGVRLLQARDWAALHPTVLNANEKAFLDASDELEKQEQVEREEQQRRDIESVRKLVETERESAARLRVRNRIILGVGVMAMVLAILAGSFGLQSNRNFISAQNEAQLRATQQAVAESNFVRAEAQRLAAEANNLLKSDGNPETIALLAIRSLNLQYSPQGDEALLGAVSQIYPVQMFANDVPLNNAAFAPDGKSVLLTGADGLAHLMDIQTGQELQHFSVPTGYTVSIFSPDGTKIVSKSDNSDVIVWDVRSGYELVQIKPDGYISHITFAKDGRSVFLGIDGATLLQIDSETGMEIRQWSFSENIGFLFPSGKKNFTYSRESSLSTLMDIETGASLYTLDHNNKGIQAQSLSVDENRYAVSYDDGSTAIWDVNSGNLVNTLASPGAMIFSLSFSPDGQSLLAGGADGILRILDIQTGRELHRFVRGTTIFQTDFSEDGSLAMAMTDNTVIIWEIEARPLHSVLAGHAGYISAVAMSPDSKLLATADSEGQLRLWNIQTSATLWVNKNAGSINYGLDYSPNGRFLLTGNWDGMAILWDARTGKAIRQYVSDKLNVIQEVVFSPDGQYFVAGGRAFGGAPVVQIWETETGKKVKTFETPAGAYSVDFSPDGRSVLSANEDGVTRSWDVSSGELIHEFTANDGVLTLGRFSPDGQTILTAGSDKVARLWDMQTGKEIRSFVGHTDGIMHASFSPDGELIATASYDNTIRLWDVSTGQELRRYIGHTAGVENVIFSPDGKFIASVADDSTVRLWDVDIQSSIQYLCEQLLRDFNDAERLEYNLAGQAPTCNNP